MLSINISELIWTGINFFLLCFLLKRFLYTPVIRFMDERKARMDAKLREEQDALTRAKENEDRLAAEKAESREEAKRILSRAGTEREEQHSAAVLATRADSSRNRKEATAALAQRREKTASRLEQATPELAALLAEQLLREK